MIKSIAIDMDNVIADIETHLVNLYEKEYNVKVDRTALLGVSEDEAFPDKTAARRFIHTPGFFRTVPLMPGALEALEILRKKYEIYIVSAATEFPLSLAEKHAWLAEFFPFISWKNMIFCGSKAVIKTDYMIDDHCKNLDYCIGKPILYHASHNVNIKHHFRVNNWQEVLAYFEKEEQNAQY